MEKSGLNIRSFSRPMHSRASPFRENTFSPLPRITTGTRVKNIGQSEPIFAAIFSRLFCGSGFPHSSFAASSAHAPFELPPPRPAPAGTRFFRSNLKCAFSPVASLKSSAAFRTRFEESVGTPSMSHESESAPSAVSARSVSPNFVGAARLRSSWNPSGRPPRTASIRFTLQGENFSVEAMP